MRIFAIDPGTEQSALMRLEDGVPVAFAIMPNHDLASVLSRLVRNGSDVLAIEWVSFYGPEIHAGSETFDTCRWVGRFQQAWSEDSSCFLVPRRAVRGELCGTAKAGDAEVRAVLIDRFGGKEKAIGKKATPGPLYGITSHCWSALAVAIVQMDRTVKLPSGKIVTDEDVPF